MSIDLLEPGTRSGGEREPDRPLSPTASHDDRAESGVTRERTRPSHPGVLGLCALVAALPLVMDPDGWYVYVHLRWLVLAIAAGGIATIVALAHRRPTRDGTDVGDRSGRRTWPPTSGWWALLLLVAVASALLSSAPLVSLSGAQDRMFGAATWVLHGTCALLAATVVRRRRDLVRLGQAMTIGLLGVGVVTIAQRGGWLVPAHAATFHRPGGPFGNADMLGAYCVLAILVSLAVLLDRDQADRWRVLAGVSCTLGLATVVLSGTRASWLALGLGSVVLLVAAVQRRVVQPTQALAVMCAALTLCVGVGLGSGAAARFDDLAGGTAQGRVETWTRTLATISERPVLGWGEEGFAQGFTGSIDSSWEQDYGRRLTPDRAHNGLLDVAATLGMVGLVAYLAVVIATGRRIGRVLQADRRGPQEQGLEHDVRGGSTGSEAATHVMLPLGIAIASAAYLLQQQALFPLADVDALAWILAGAMVGLSTGVAGPTAARHTTRTAVATHDTGTAATLRAKGSPRRCAELAAALFAALSLAGAVAIGTTQFLADRHARSAADASARGEYVAAIRSAEAALRLAPGQVLDTLLLADAATASRDSSRMRDAVRRVDRERSRSLDDGRLVLAEARLLLALHDRTVDTAGDTTGDTTAGTADDPDLRHAVDLLGGLLRHDDARSEAWLLLGDVHARSGETAPAMYAWRLAAELRPLLLDPRLRLLRSHTDAGRVAEAGDVLAEIDRIGEPSSSSGRFDLMVLRARVAAAG